jgi:hypothetical protein
MHEGKPQWCQDGVLLSARRKGKGVMGRMGQGHLFSCHLPSAIRHPPFGSGLPRCAFAEFALEWTSGFAGGIKTSVPPEGVLKKRTKLWVTPFSDFKKYQ